MPVAAIAAVAVAAGASAYAASEQADANQKANEQTIQNARDTNSLNYKMFQESRGSQGNAVYPLYMKTASGQPFESSVLAQNAMGLYNQLSQQDSSADQVARTSAILSNFQPTITASNDFAASVFNGGMEQQEMNAQADVASARQGGVVAKKQAGMEALAQTLNEINAIQAGKGYSGDSFGNRLLKSNAMRQTATATASDQAAVNVQNASDRAAVKNSMLQTKLNNLSLPYNMVRQNVNLQNLPGDTAMDEEARRQQLFNSFRIGVGQFTYQPLPAVQPVPSKLGIAMQGISSMAQGVGSYYAAGSGGGYSTPPQYYNMGSSGGGMQYAPAQSAPEVINI